MNIDLRNVSEEFEKNVNLTKDKFDIKTNIGAVEIMVNNYHTNCGTIKMQQLKIQDLEAKLKSKEFDLKEVKDSIKVLLEFAK